MSAMNRIGPPVSQPKALNNNKAVFVQDALRERGYRALKYGTNTYILKKLSETQYAGFLKLLDVVRKHVRQNYAVGERDTLSLTLPWARKLRVIDFDKLLASEAAMKRVFDLCVMPGGKLEVNFNLLLWIYNTEVVNQ